jgi:hypothetical protein
MTALETTQRVAADAGFARVGSLRDGGDPPTKKRSF